MGKLFLHGKRQFSWREGDGFHYTEFAGHGFEHRNGWWTKCIVRDKYVLILYAFNGPLNPDYTPNVEVRTFFDSVRVIKAE